jgi:hypothetical protein
LREKAEFMIGIKNFREITEKLLKTKNGVLNVLEDTMKQ